VSADRSKIDDVAASATRSKVALQMLSFIQSRLARSISVVTTVSLLMMPPNLYAV
jgi:hypothetical protein